MVTIRTIPNGDSIMSNTRKPRWAAAEITTANAEKLLAELAAVVAAEENPVTRRMLAEVWDRLDAQGRTEEFPALAEQFRADAARETIGGRFVANLQAAGHDPALIALAEQRVMELGADFWAEMYHTITG